jgi:hypothetical protein
MQRTQDMANIDPLLRRNKDFAATGAHETASIVAKYPVYVITCLDPRTDPSAFLGLELGDAMVIRNAGGRVSPGVLKDLAYIGYLSRTLVPGGPVAAIVTSTPALLLLGTVLAGLGFGPGNLGAYRVIMARAVSSDRAGLIAAVSTVNYLAFGLPALIAGIATSHFGLHDTALVYSVGIALLAVAAAGGFLFEGNARTRAPRAVASPPELPPGPCTVPPR